MVFDQSISVSSAEGLCYWMILTAAARTIIFQRKKPLHMPQESILSEFNLGQSEVEIRNHQTLINSSLLSQLLNFSMSEVIVVVPDDLALTLRL